MAQAIYTTGDIDEAIRDDARAKVRRGMGFLDEWRSNWLDVIDVDRLDIGLSCACVWGQLEGDFWTGIARTGHATINEFGTIRPDWDWAVDHGFASPTSLDYANYAVLTAVWREEITVRRLLNSVDGANNLVE